MTDPNNDAADIAWLRNLAAEGATAPFRGASVLLAAGLIYGVASLVQWAKLTGVIGGSPMVLALNWLIATGVFLVVLAVLIWRMRSSVGVRTTGNRVVGTVWACVGWAIFVLSISMMVNDYRMGPAQSMGPYWLMASIIMVFYGLGWAVTASLFGNGRLWWLSIGSFAAAPVLQAFTGSPNQYLAYAAALFGLMALPGFLLMRAANRG